MSKVPTLAELLAQTHDIELVDGVDELIDRRYDCDPNPRSFTPEELVVAQVWRSRVYIANGGFERLFSSFFEGDETFELTLNAYKTLGMMKCYEVFREALELCGPIPPDAESAYEQYIAAAGEEHRDKLNDRFYDEDRDFRIATVLAAYIRRNADKLRHLDEPKPARSTEDWDMLRMWQRLKTMFR